MKTAKPSTAESRDGTDAGQLPIYSIFCSASAKDIRRAELNSLVKKCNKYMT